MNEINQKTKINNDIKDKKNENIIQNNNNKETEGGLANKAKIFESNQVNKTSNTESKNTTNILKRDDVALALDYVEENLNIIYNIYEFCWTFN